MERIKRYLIIGASSEVGMAFIRLLEKRATEGRIPDGVHIMAHYGSHDDELRKLEKECPYLAFEYLQCDLGSREQVDALAEQLEGMETPQAFLYLAAGRMRYEKLKKMELERLDQDYCIQVRALARLCQAVLPSMAKEKFGKAVIMLSECTLGMPPKYTAEYTAVKYAALGLMRTFSLEYADKNVNVNGLSPTMMETGFLSDIDPRFIEMNASGCVKKRNATVEEAAQAMAFLVSAGSDYMNGVNLNLSGGNQA